jgi:ethanolamine utilization protein EutP (predicted NTPase)
MQNASHAEERLSYMYVTQFNRGRIISLTKLDIRRRRRRRSALLAVAGDHKMKQISQEKLRGKSNSILKAEKYLPDQV